MKKLYLILLLFALSSCGSSEYETPSFRYSNPAHDAEMSAMHYDQFLSEVIEKKKFRKLKKQIQLRKELYDSLTSVLSDRMADYDNSPSDEKKAAVLELESKFKAWEDSLKVFINNNMICLLLIKSMMRIGKQN